MQGGEDSWPPERAAWAQPQEGVGFWGLQPEADHGHPQLLQKHRRNEAQKDQEAGQDSSTCCTASILSPPLISAGGITETGSV